MKRERSSDREASSFRIQEVDQVDQLVLEFGQPVSGYSVPEHQVSPSPGPLADVDGVDLRPDLSLAFTPADLVAALSRYRIWAGEPSFREMARRAGHAIAPSTMCTALHADTMPRLDTVRAIVVGCGGGDEDQRQFVSAWRRIRLDTSGGKPGGHLVPAPRHPARNVSGC